jgi:periodic tryptophan protein 1
VSVGFLSFTFTFTERSEDGSDESGDEDGDVEMGGSKKSKTAGATNTAPPASSDPNDLSAYNLDTYDDEVSRGAGVFFILAGFSRRLVGKT